MTRIQGSTGAPKRTGAKKRASGSGTGSGTRSIATEPERSVRTRSGGKRRSSNVSAERPSQAKKQKGEASLVATPQTQCASYALELLSHGGIRSHVIAALITDSSIELLYYDHSMVIISHPMDFVLDPPRFVAMLKSIQEFTLEQWGYALPLHPVHYKPPAMPPQKNIFNGLTLKLANGCVLKFNATIHQPHGLIGRGTCVVGAKCIKKGPGVVDDGWDDELIVKFSWPAESRTAENEIIKKITAAADNDEHRWMLRHLPKVLHAEDKDCCLLSEEMIKILGNYEKRLLRILVLEKLTPITERTTASDLAVSYREIVQCVFSCCLQLTIAYSFAGYRWVFEHTNYMHRDISVRNLMTRKQGDQVYGVLNDFDLATKVDRTVTSSKQRTGTQPFMAIELLRPNPPGHLFRHDLESFFYVLVWIITRYHNGKVIETPPLQEWEDYGRDLLPALKNDFLYSESIVHSTANYKSIFAWARRLRSMFANAYSARRIFRDEQEELQDSEATHLPSGPSSSFDNSTLGDRITFDKFEAILTDVVDKEVFA